MLNLNSQEVQNKESKMRIVCSWCEKVLGYRKPYNKTETTHGICGGCNAKLIKDFNKKRGS